MKGIMFNLLESLAHEAGCSDEAWELVVEFAAAEALLDQATNSRVRRPSRGPLSYSSPTEAMVRCLSQGDLGERRSWDLLEAAQHHEWTAQDWPTSAQTLDNQASPSGGFSAEAFLEPEALLENWCRDPRQPLERRSADEEEADAWLRAQRPRHKGQT